MSVLCTFYFYRCVKLIINIPGVISGADVCVLRSLRTRLIVIRSMREHASFKQLVELDKAIPVQA